MPRRPIQFGEMIGQRRAIRHMQKFIDGAKAQGKAFPSSLLIGPAGWGKTTLAKAIATSFGTECHYLLASADLTPDVLCALLRKLRHGDVFVLDEAHALSREAQQLLHVALDDSQVPAEVAGRLDFSQLESIADFTLVVVTNLPGKLPRAFKSRLWRVELEPYSLDELRAIALRIAQETGISLSPQAASLLAVKSQGSPRVIRGLVSHLQLFYHDVIAQLSVEHIRQFFDSAGIDEVGLTTSQRRYLSSLAASPGQQCSLARLAILVGTDERDICEDIEPYLIAQGYVEISARRGRALTILGRDVIQKVSPPPCSSEEELQS